MDQPLIYYLNTLDFQQNHNIFWPKPVDHPYIIKLETVVDGCVFCFPFYPLKNHNIYHKISLNMFLNPWRKAIQFAIPVFNCLHLKTKMKSH